MKMIIAAEVDTDWFDYLRNKDQSEVDAAKDALANGKWILHENEIFGDTIGDIRILFASIPQADFSYRIEL